MERLSAVGSLELAEWVLTHLNPQDDPSNMKQQLANIGNQFKVTPENIALARKSGKIEGKVLMDEYMENSLKNRKPNSVNVDLDVETQKLIEESSRRLAEQRELDKANRSMLKDTHGGGEGEGGEGNEGGDGEGGDAS